MNQAEFTERRNKIAESTLHNVNILDDDLLNRTQNFVSANMLNFMPEIRVTEHEDIFRHILLNKDLSILEQQYEGIMESVSYEGLSRQFFNLLDSKPAIFCTFHMGSNRVINHFLASNNIPYTLVVANHISNDEGSSFGRMFSDIYRDGTQNNLNIISAQLPNAALKMLKELKGGKSLLLYIDGNTGAGDDSVKNGNRCKINFLKQSIYARKGIAYLSHLANVPIVTAVCYRKSLEDIRLKFFSPIYPNGKQSRADFAEETTQKLYDMFVPILKLHPEQWECWIYLHTMINSKEFIYTEDQPLPEQFLLNKDKFGFFNIGTELFLFNKKTYNSYPIDQLTYKILFKSATQPIEKGELNNNNLFQQLYNNQVFINV
jgi:lauroyl/myristoyl acyltransferase